MLNIFVGNLTEGSGPYIRGIKNPTDQENLIKEDNVLSDRFLYSCPDNTILITPLPINQEFKKDIEEILKLKNVVNWNPKTNSISISKDIEVDKDLFKKLVETIKDSKERVKMWAYANTPEFAKLVLELQERGCKFDTPEMPEKKFYWTQSFLDSKGGFRQIVQIISGWEKEVKMPWGIICARPTEARKIGLVLFSQQKGFVVKTNWGQSGEGLIIVRRNNGYKDFREVSEFLKTEFKKEDYWDRDLIVVEEYIEPNKAIGGGAPNVEGFIDKDGEVKLLCSCGMRLTQQGNFRGVEIGREVFDEATERKIRKIAKEIGEEFADFGYRGFFEVDMQAGRDHEIYCLESNMRRTGGTHVFEGMKRLYGASFDGKYFVSNNWFGHPAISQMTYARLKEKLSSIWYPRGGRKSGYLPTVVNSMPMGHLGYIVIGENKQEAEEIEEKLKNLLDNG